MKKKIIITSLIDIVALIALIVSVYLLMSRDLNQWQSNLATVVAVLALPVIFYSIFTKLAFNKYDKVQKKDEKSWEEEE